MIGQNSSNGWVGNQANSVSATETRASEAEVPHQLECLERTLKGCAQGLETLADKLQSSVMRTDPPSPVASTSDKLTACMQTPYGSRLQELTSFAAILNARIQSFVSRLEV